MEGKHIALGFGLVSLISSFLFVLKRKLALSDLKNVTLLGDISQEGALEEKSVSAVDVTCQTAKVVEDLDQSTNESSTAVSDHPLSTEIMSKTIFSDDFTAFKDKMISLGITPDIYPYFELDARTKANSSGVFLKNIFLKDRKGHYYLLMISEDKQLDLKKLRRQVNAHRNFSFVCPSEVKELLRVNPGGVTPFGLLFSQNKTISVILDKSFAEETRMLNFHPLDESKTMRIHIHHLLKFIESVGFECKLLDLPYT